MNGRIVRAVSCIESLVIVIQLIDHTAHAGDINSSVSSWLQFSRLRCCYSLFRTTQFKVKASEDGASRQLVQLNARATNVPCLSDFPEPYVLVTATDQLVVVDWTELELDDVELRNLFCKDFSLLSRVDSRDVPHDYHFFGIDHFFFILFLFTLFTDYGQELPVGRERNTLDRSHWHSQHLKTPGRVVIPNPNNRALSILG